MHSSRRLFLIICFLIFILGSAGGQEKSGDIHTLLWKMAVLKKSGSAYESVAFRRTTLTMIKNDAFKIYLGFDSAGYCYIVQENDEGKLPVVYRKNVSPGDRLTLPGNTLPEKADAGGDFRARDSPGSNRFYVIVSALPRQNLEKLMEQHEQNPSDTSLERSILSEVLAIRRSISSLSESSTAGGGPGEDKSGSARNNPQAGSSGPQAGSSGQGATVSPTGSDPAMKGELRLFQGREAWVVTVTVRVQ